MSITTSHPNNGMKKDGAFLHRPEPLFFVIRHLRRPIRKRTVEGRLEQTSGNKARVPWQIYPGVPSRISAFPVPLRIVRELSLIHI